MNGVAGAEAEQRVVFLDDVAVPVEKIAKGLFRALFHVDHHGESSKICHRPVKPLCDNLKGCS
jgi:hypothetical protein